MIATVQIERRASLDLDLRDDAWALTLQHACNQHLRSSRDRMILRWPDGEPEPVDVVSEIVDAYERCRMGERTVSNNGARSARNFIATLQRRTPWYPRVPWASFAGRPAFVVGAGPSLDRNIALLHEARKHGPLIANQTSARALLSAGIEPDIVCCVESVDCTYWLGPIPRHIPMLVKASAHPGNFEHSDHVTTFTNHDPAYARYAAAMRSVPLPFSTSVAAASGSLAFHGGCSEVVLVGMDLAYTGGRCYAAGTRVEDLRIDLDGSLMRYTGDSEQRAPESVRYRDAWGGRCVVPTTYGMDLMALWWERVAQDGRFRVVNATEGGSRIAGASERRLQDVLSDSRPDFERAPMRTHDPAATAGVLCEMRAVVQRVLDESPVMPPPDLPILNLWTVGASIRTAGAPTSERVQALREATRQAASEVLAAIGGGTC